MRERAILFSDAMVRAILDGRKTQTRRVVEPQPPSEVSECFNWSAQELGPETKSAEGCYLRTERGLHFHSFCPLGQPGDRLWVRECWADVNTEDGPAICYRSSRDVRTWRDFSTTFGPDYGAGPSMDYDAYPGTYAMWWSDLLAAAPDHSWRSSTHMPRWASRLSLEITGVRVERVQDIGEQDVNAGGLPEDSENSKLLRDATGISRKDCFAVLWDQLNAKRGHTWEANPWVWVISFRIV